MDKLAQIPYSIASGVENMAQDVAMLMHGSGHDLAMWRLYGWNEAAITFGYSQKWTDIQNSTRGFDGARIRRLTGGGIVDHRNDLTYALSLPSSHSFHRVQAGTVYEGLHCVIANILTGMGFQSDLAPCEDSCAKSDQTGVSVCFQAPEPFDVMDPRTGRKQAGAAMKRSRSGLLVQGSLSLDAVPALDRERFETAFGAGLADWLNLRPGSAAILPDALTMLERKRFSSTKWNRRR